MAVDAEDMRILRENVAKYLEAHDRLRRILDGDEPRSKDGMRELRAERTSSGETIMGVMELIGVNEIDLPGRYIRCIMKWKKLTGTTTNERCLVVRRKRFQ